MLIPSKAFLESYKKNCQEIKETQKMPVVQEFVLELKQEKSLADAKVFGFTVLTTHSKGVITAQLHFIQGFGL